jgi:primosomal protein N' (replication factor Y)
MDSDTTSRKGSYFRILKAFAKGETQVLIGTQMIAKGHDFPNVTLAGVVAADQALGMPDFRAAERTFQLLTQVAGRSGRGETPGEVIVQTRFPNHYSLKYACQQNYASFYQHELEYRRSMAYPPFTYLANLICKGTVQARVLRAAEAVGGALQEMRREMNLEKQVRILGPNPAPLERIKGNFRFQILLKSIQREDLLRLLRATLRRFAGSRADTGKLTIDLDPLNLL